MFSLVQSSQNDTDKGQFLNCSFSHPVCPLLFLTSFWKQVKASKGDELLYNSKQKLQAQQLKVNSFSN